MLEIRPAQTHFPDNARMVSRDQSKAHNLEPAIHQNNDFGICELSRPCSFALLSGVAPENRSRQIGRLNALTGFFDRPVSCHLNRRLASPGSSQFFAKTSDDSWHAWMLIQDKRLDTLSAVTISFNCGDNDLTHIDTTQQDYTREINRIHIQIKTAVDGIQIKARTGNPPATIN